MGLEWLRTARRWTVDPRVVDPVLVASSVGLTALAAKTPWSPLPRWVIVFAGLAGSLAVWWHRRRPDVVTVAGAVTQALSGNPGPLLVGLFQSGRLRSRWLPLLVCVGAAAFVGIAVVEGDPVGFGDMAAAALLSAVVGSIGAYVGTRRELLESLQDRAERAEGERHLRVEQARAAERARIAREMHDVLAHKMSLIALHSGALEVDPAAGPARVEQAATLIGSTARDALHELRWVLGLLRPDVDANETDQLADIHQLVAQWERAGIDVELRDEAGPMPAAIERAAYRLVQEGLTNAHKHAPGAPVVVTLTDMTGTHGREVVVSVANGAPTGACHDGLPGAGTGLVGLGERLRLVGGTLASGRHDGGWKLEGRFPWRPDGPGPVQDQAGHP